MNSPQEYVVIVERLKARLYAALKHEKSCICGACSGGLNAVDDLAILAVRAAELEVEANMNEALTNRWMILAEDYKSRANELEHELGKVAARAIQLERKADLYDRALAVVKTEGNTRAYYVLRAEAAEARVEQLETALRAYDELFRAWEGRVQLTLNDEAIGQWRSIARTALDGEPA